MVKIFILCWNKNSRSFKTATRCIQYVEFQDVSSIGEKNCVCKKELQSITRCKNLPTVKCISIVFDSDII